jgi:hypothetical protein
MPDEPENLVLVQLREMRSELQGVRSKLEERYRRFDRIDRRTLCSSHGVMPARPDPAPGKAATPRQLSP